MKKLLTFLLVFLTAFTLASPLVSAREGTPVRVGSKDFTESLIIAEIYALALEDNDIEVERVFNVASSVVHTSIINDEVDLYPEYTGTGLLAVLQLPMETDPEKVYEIVSEAYQEEFDLTWLNYAQANNSQGIAIRTQIAEELSITTISDLQAQASAIRFASQGEFDMREDGIPGLESVYGEFDFASSTIYDNSLKYQVLESDEADATPAYTTEGQLVQTDKFLVLEDDQQFWPPYNLAPVVRNDQLASHPEIADILNKISQYIDTPTAQALNAAVDVEGRDYEEVALEFYESIKE